jgi:hypothetical protein
MVPATVQRLSIFLTIAVVFFAEQTAAQRETRTQQLVLLQTLVALLETTSARYKEMLRLRMD